MKEELWLGDNGAIVCERVSCAGGDLYARIVTGRGLESSHVTETGVRFSRLTKQNLAEFAVLIMATTGKLECDGGHVRYNPQKRELQVSEPAA